MTTQVPPPLPEPDPFISAASPMFNADQLRERDRWWAERLEEAVKQERERCAAAMSALIAKYEDDYSDNGWWFRDQAEDCLSEIRSPRLSP